MALLSTIGPDDRLGDPGGELSTDTRPQAVACYNPVLDFTDEPLIWPSQMNFLGVPPEGKSGIYYQSSPALRVKGREPPFLFLYGNRDILTPESKSRKMITRLAGFGIPVEVAFFHGMGHGFGYRLRAPEQKRAANVVAEFFNMWLK